MTALVGFPEANPAPRGRPLFNAVAHCRGGSVVAVTRKSLLPTYDVFDESRYFEPVNDLRLADFPARTGDTRRVGVCICEDIWNDDEFVPRPLYARNPAVDFAEAGAELLLNVSASPFSRGKQAFRERLFGGQAAKHPSAGRRRFKIYRRQLGTLAHASFDRLRIRNVLILRDISSS